MGTFKSTNEANNSLIEETITNQQGEYITFGSIRSGVIPKDLALSYISHYQIPENRLGLKTSNNADVNGFYFDAKHVKDLVDNLHDENDRVYIALAKVLPDSNIDHDYTLVLTAARPTFINGAIRFKYVHHDSYTPWIEFAKPCPDQCPIDL